MELGKVSNDTEGTKKDGSLKKFSFLFYREKPSLFHRWDIRCLMFTILSTLYFYINSIKNPVIQTSADFITMNRSICNPSFCWISAFSANQSRLPFIIHKYCILEPTPIDVFERFRPQSHITLYFFLCSTFSLFVFLLAHWYLWLDCKLNYKALSSDKQSLKENQEERLKEVLNESEKQNYRNLLSLTTHVLVTPLNTHTKPFAQKKLCPLIRSQHHIFLYYQQKKYIYDENYHNFEPLHYPVNLSLEQYISTSGIPSKPPTLNSVLISSKKFPELDGSSKDDSVSYSKSVLIKVSNFLQASWQNEIKSSSPLLLEKFGENRCQLPIPSFYELYKEHLLSPILIFQILCGLIWLIDDYYMFGMMNLGMLFSIEAMMVKSRLTNIRRINQMDLPTSHVYVFRQNSWTKEHVKKLLPGDIIALSTKMTSSENTNIANPTGNTFTKTNSTIPSTSDKTSAICPVDALLLQGSVVANESILTGESMPQLRQDLTSLLGEGTNIGQEKLLDLKQDHKTCLLCAGTTLTLVHNSNTQFRSVRLPAPSMCVAYVLRTGFGTTHGKMQRSIYFSQQPSSTQTATNNKEITYFLLILLAFALLSAGYVLHHGLKNGHSSLFRLILNCSHIVLSVVPPEFPIISSSTISLTIMELFKKHVYCTEPHRLPHAGSIDICAFDKTGTLTSDSMDVVGIFGFNGDTRIHKSNSATDEDVISASQNTYNKNKSNDDTKESSFVPPQALIEFFQKISDAAKAAAQLTKQEYAKREKGKRPSTFKSPDSYNFFDPSEDPVSKNIEKKQPIQPPPHPFLPSLTQAVMGTCHSLVKVENEITGDPLEKAAFEYLGWSLPSIDIISTEKSTKIENNNNISKSNSSPPTNDNNSNNNNNNNKNISATAKPKLPFNPRNIPHFPLPPKPTLGKHQFNIVRKFPFASELQRMTVVCTVSPSLSPNTSSNDSSSSDYYVFCKGSPERLKDFLNEVPAFYDGLATFLTRRGYRVIALASKKLQNEGGNVSQCVRWERNLLESSLRFEGFLVFSCPIKQNTIESLQALKNGGFPTLMITGDNPLTGTQVAEDLAMIPSFSSCPVYLLQIVSKKDKEEEKSSEEFLSKVVSESTTRMRNSTHSNISKSRFSEGEIALEKEKAGGFSSLIKRIFGFSNSSQTNNENYNIDNNTKWMDTLEWVDRSGINKNIKFSLLDGKEGNPSILSEKATLGIAGDALEQVSSMNIISTLEVTERLKKLIPFVSLFFRVSPRQKASIISTLNSCNLTTLMCGDGANDMGALKAASVGISLYYLSNDKAKDYKKSELNQQQLGTQKRPTFKEIYQQIQQQRELQRSGQMRGDSKSKGAILNNALSMLEDPDQMLMFKPGDASIAAPFSYTRDDIRCVPLLVRFGRSTLSTIMMMYKLMAISSLVTAFVFSVLTLDGVKSGEVQNVVQGILMSAAMFIVSKARPSNMITKHRLSRSLFDTHFLVSIFLQFFLHLFILFIGWSLAKQYRPPFFKPSLDSPFMPNIVNTTIFYLLSSINFSTILCNYDGLPFLIPLTQIPYLRNVLFFAIGGLFLVSLEITPQLNHMLALVPLPNTMYRITIFLLVFFDCFGVWLIAHIIRSHALKVSLRNKY